MIELFHNNPTLELVERIADALNIKKYKLFIDPLSPNVELERLLQEIRREFVPGTVAYPRKEKKVTN